MEKNNCIMRLEGETDIDICWCCSECKTMFGVESLKYMEMQCPVCHKLILEFDIGVVCSEN